MSMCFLYETRRMKEQEKKVSTKKNIVKVKWLKLKNFVNLQNTWRKVVKWKFHFMALLMLPSFYTFYSSLFSLSSHFSFGFNDVEYYAQISISRNACCNRFPFSKKKASFFIFSIEFFPFFLSDWNDKLKHTYVYIRH